MKTTVQKWGNSLALRLPKALAEEAKIREGSKVELVGTPDRKLVLVVQYAELRPFLRRLVELEFPHLMAISQEELLPMDEPSQTAPVGGVAVHA